MTNLIDNTLLERGQNYGSFKDNADITQTFMKVLSQAPNFYKLTDQHLEAFHMIFHKISRCVCGDPFYIDNIHDISGYAKLLENYLLKHEKGIND
jgi:hypothetical protein